MKKVSTQEREPKKEGTYHVFLRSEQKATAYFVPNKNWTFDSSRKMWADVTHWLDESEDSAPVDVRDVVESSSEAVKIIRALMSNPHLNLGDLVYNVREREGEGWEGPAVVAWGKAVADAERFLKEAGGGK